MSSFHVIRFKKKIEFVHELKMLQSDSKQQNQSTGSFNLTFKKNIINNHELQNYNCL